MNPLGAVFDGLRKNGLDVEIQRQHRDGGLVRASENELASLGTKSRVATTAQLLAKLSPAEKETWAQETKEEANALFAESNYEEALQKYMECLAASDFGSLTHQQQQQRQQHTPSLNESCRVEEHPQDQEESDLDSKDQSRSILSDAGNVDTLVVPVLCNMSSCSLKMELWGKAISFADQAIQLRPQCSRAYLKKGVGFLRLGEFELALESLQQAQDTAAPGATISLSNEEESEPSEQSKMESRKSNNHTTAINELSLYDRHRLPKLIQQAKNGLKKERLHLQQQREALQRAFATRSAKVDAFMEDVMNVEDEAEHRLTSATSNSSDRKANERSLPPEASEEVELMTFTELLQFFFTMLLRFIFRLFTSSKRKTAAKLNTKEE